MESLENIREMGFGITWDIVRLGWSGPGSFSKQISIEEIQKYADEMVCDASEKELLYIAELSTCQDEQLISDLLLKLSPSISQFSERIWRMVLLRKTIDSLPDDPLEGMISLTSFWSQFEYPDDSPHIIQGRGNDISPVEYYTRNFFEMIKEKHKRWLQDEIVDLEELKTRMDN